MFSPYYAWARRRGPADPLRFCALNVVLSGPRGRWAMTERGATAVTRTPTTLAIGPSALEWDRSGLTITIDEVTMPIPRRVRGTVRVHPGFVSDRRFDLDVAGRHRWGPIAPGARVEVALDRPGVTWGGEGYLDTNAGSEPMEDAFERWDWCRAGLKGGTAVLYDVTPRDGGERGLALLYDRAGRLREFAPPPSARLKSSRWGVARGTRGDRGGAARVARTLVDAPFYARSVIETRLLGEDVTAMHESLSLDRFRTLWVQAMLPFRIPRARR